MTNENEQQQDAEFQETEDIVAEESEDKPAALPAPERKNGKGGAGIAWLALFLALVAAAGAGYMVVQDWRARGEAAASASSMNELRSRLATSSDAMQALSLIHISEPTRLWSGSRMPSSA